MSELSRILGRYAVGHQIVHKGKTFTFSIITKEQRVNIEKAWYKHMREALKQFSEEGEYDHKELQRLLTELREKYLAGGFDLAGSQGGQVIATAWAGQVLLVQTICNCTKDEAEDLLTEHLVEVKEVLAVTFATSFGDLKERALAQEGNGESPNA